jgi:hypothetical protein
MTALGVFPASVEDALSAPHVDRVMLARFDFGDGAGGTVTRRFHAGVGTIRAGGYDWLGVTDPGGTRVVALSFIELPTPQVLSKVDVTLTGVDSSFLSQVRQDVGLVYGAFAEIYMQLYVSGTAQPIGNPVTLFDNGRCGAPAFSAAAVGRRTLTIPIDGVWSARNFAPGGRINDADQKARYPGDRGAEAVGGVASETIR